MPLSDLLREARQHYNQLVPPKDAGLILLTLFNRYQGGEFTEDQIIDIIRQVNKDLGKPQGRNEYERENQVVIRLQEFFLWRDSERKVYRFKKYGLEFCKRINNRLLDSYSPAKIKRIFNYLLDELKKSLSGTDGDLNTWVEDHFSERGNELAEQIEILDQQVAESVKLFRYTVKSQHESIIQLIDSIEKNLEAIKKQASDLTNAFQVTFDIDELLQQLLESDQAYPYLDNIKFVRTYNEQVRSHLEQVSLRIDKIKPRLREFIYDFNQRELDRKTDRFIHYLLDRSAYQRSPGGPKRLTLPPDIPAVALKRADLVSCFCIVPERDLLPKPPQPAIVRAVDPERTRQMMAGNERVLYLRNRITYWANEALRLIEEQGEIDFSAFFYHILAEEKGNLQIPVRTAHRVIKEVQDRSRFGIEVQTETYIPLLPSDISLWKMKISKKN
ncbi:hypothetical protein [Mucilaginibacter sp.]|uniref:hypothetical protein n=1 Tax=Mucilaginibacter sp. TaxID=1882438 RepID=UPI0026102841|nr:hypothetical protein [Mucilaginibacter sp.]MDB4922904.1 hypothetical protein [Mucilaginibacter sp.]